MSGTSNPFRSLGKKSGKKLRRSLGSSISLAPFTSTPSNLSRQGSVSSLRSLAVTPTYDDQKNKSEGWKSAFKRKLNLKSPNEEKEDNRSINSLSLSLSPIKRNNSLTSLSVAMSPVKTMDVHESFVEADETPRGIERRDMGVCWLDHTQFKVIRGNFRAKDVLTKLIDRPPTRHLARHILTFLREEDFTAMLEVTHPWKKFLNTELSGPLLFKIKMSHKSKKNSYHSKTSGIRQNGLSNGFKQTSSTEFRRCVSSSC